MRGRNDLRIGLHCNLTGHPEVYTERATVVADDRKLLASSVKRDHAHADQECFGGADATLER
ncbi:MAG: hypothetical protein U0572_06135 [Phycisphaerales bacterium]